jgi:pimeloyl-ACP methyl ester carboxylesterase
MAESYPFKNLTMSLQEKIIKRDGSQIFYRTSGKGAPVVLVHGFGEDGEIWNRLLPALSQQHRVIVPDIPGSGRSERLKSGISKSAPAHAPSLERYADVLRFLIESESAAPCTLIGHSMGGYITLAFAEQYGSMLNGMGLFHSTAAPDSEEKIANRLKGIGFIETYGASAFLRQAIPNLFGEKFKLDNAVIVEDLVEKGKYFSAESLIGYYQAMIQRPDRKAVLERFAKPVLFIMGEEDKAVNLPEQLSQSYLPAESHVYIWKDTGHMGMLERPEESIAVLLKFLGHVNEN